MPLGEFLAKAACLAALSVALVVFAVRAVRARGARFVVRGARSRGWSCEHTGARVCLSGAHEGVAWRLECPRDGARSSRKPLVWSAPCPACAGLLVVQARPPALLRGSGGGFAPLLRATLESVMGRISPDELASLRELEGDEACPVGVYRSAPGHAAEGAAEVLRALVAGWPAREKGALALWVERDRVFLQLRNNREHFEDVEALVSAGLRAHGALVGSREGSYRAG